MKSFSETSSIRAVRLLKIVLIRPIRHFILNLPCLPLKMSRTLDDIRFVEPDVIRFVMNTVKSGWKCADIGAHCGTVSIRMAILVGNDGAVMAFEPVESNLQLLKQRIEETDICGVCRIFPFAIGAVNGGMTMMRGEHSTTWKFSEEESTGSAQDHCVVECRTLDSLLAETGHLDFIKVDIEGAEVCLVTGAGRIIREIRPIWLFEMHTAASWSVLETYFENSYRAFDLSGCEIFQGHPTHQGYGHVVLCPSEKIAMLR